MAVLSTCRWSRNVTERPCRCRVACTNAMGVSWGSPQSKIMRTPKFSCPSCSVRLEVVEYGSGHLSGANIGPRIGADKACVRLRTCEVNVQEIDPCRIGKVPRLLGQHRIDRPKMSPADDRHHNAPGRDTC